MRRLLIAALVLGGGLLIAASCGGGSAKTLTVDGAWARSTPADATNGVIYLTITSPLDDRIVGLDVPSDVARTARMHTSMAGDDGGSMANMPGMEHDASGTMTEMRALPSVQLPAGEPVSFSPGERHIMLSGLVHPLAVGDTVSLTLRFQNSPEVTLEVPVSDNPL